MNKELIAEASIDINTNPETMWQVLTDPVYIKQYLYGTEAITDWKVGSDIIFQGEYEGQTYKDKGVVRLNEPHSKLVYDYWSGFSGLPDLPENYFKVSYIIKPISDKEVNFTWHQAGFADENRQQHTQNGLGQMLKAIKQIAEQLN